MHSRTLSPDLCQVLIEPSREELAAAPTDPKGAAESRTSALDLERLADLIAQRLPRVHEVMTTAEAADYLRCSTQHLEIARHKGGGPKYVKFSRLVRYRKVDLDEYLAARVRSNTIERVK